MLGELTKGMLFVGGGPGGYENFHWNKSRLRKMMWSFAENITLVASVIRGEQHVVHV